MPSLKNKKILITGGAGFIGSHLTEALLKYGCRITVIDKKKEAKKKVKYLQKNLNQLGAKDIQNFDFLFHLAGSASVRGSLDDPQKDFRDNIEGTFYLLEQIRRLKNPPIVVFASTAAVYGIPQKMPVNEKSLTNPVSPYGASKLAAEKYLQVYSHLYQIPTVILRPFSVYGPGQRKQVISDLMTKIKKSPQKLEVSGRPDQLLDLIYIDDLIQGIILASQKSPARGETYNLASGGSIEIKEVIKVLTTIFEIRPQIQYLKESRPGANLKWRVDISKLKDLGFKPKVSLSEGIKKTYQWFNSLE